MSRVRAAIVGVAGFLLGMLTVIGLLVLNQRLPPPRVLMASGPSDSYVLVAPRQSSIVELIDHRGAIVHEWKLPRATTGTVELLPDDSLMFIADDRPGEVPSQPTGASGIGLMRVTWDGRIQWEHDDSRIHHDWEVLPDGTVAALRARTIAEDLAEKIAGGAPATEFGDGQMYTDQIVEIDPVSGTEEIAFDFTNVLDPDQFPIPGWMTRAEWTHSNTLDYTPSDPVTGQEAYLISSRVLSTIWIVSRDTGTVIWSYGGKWVLNQQHDPSFLKNGNILLFDNGQYRRGQPSGSQVLEINPRTNDIVWAFPERLDPLNGLYSSIISGAQRLRNGNTLVTYGVPGRVIEVTPPGDIVWDAQPAPGEAIFKARAYPAGRFDDGP